MQPEPIAITGRGPRNTLIRFDPAEDPLRYMVYVTIFFILFFIPFLSQAGREELYIYASLVAIFICIYFLNACTPTLSCIRSRRYR